MRPPAGAGCDGCRCCSQGVHNVEAMQCNTFVYHSACTQIRHAVQIRRSRAGSQDCILFPSRSVLVLWCLCVKEIYFTLCVLGALRMPAACGAISKVGCVRGCCGTSGRSGLHEVGLPRLGCFCKGSSVVVVIPIPPGYVKI